jgi:hypothetical protein
MKRLTAPSRGWFFIASLVAFALGAAIGFLSFPARAQFIPPPPTTDAAREL